jgi:hypothetical protein
MNFVKYNESLENRLGTIEEHVDGLINDPETNKLALVAELDLVGTKSRTTLNGITLLKILNAGFIKS